MTFEEILKALESLQDGSKYVEGLKKLVADKDNEISKKASDLSTVKIKAKADGEKLKELSTKLEKFYDALGLDDSTDDIEKSIETIMKSKSNDPALQTQVNKLKAKLATQEQEFNSKLGEEKSKRFEGLKRTALLEALTANDANEPNLLVDMLINKIVINEDDESMNFNDDKNSKVGDYVKEFLAAHPILIANTQKNGAGSLLGSINGKDGKENTEFAQNLAKNNNTGDNAKALESYFN